MFQNSIWMIPISFRQIRLPCRSVSDCSRLLSCLYCEQSEEYSAKWDRGFKPQSHSAEYFFRLFTIEINSAIANSLKPIGMMKMQCVTIHPNIYECVSDYMKIHQERF